jgi:hypothetical protein
MAGSFEVRPSYERRSFKAVGGAPCRVSVAADVRVSESSHA